MKKCFFIMYFLLKYNQVFCKFEKAYFAKIHFSQKFFKYFVCNLPA
ncbi:hypothetical protein SMU58_00060 [Streptococcus mutans A19]|uniref:Uncharacterized protein n=1 Tax=Streptococcus mutans SM6 TaxID=857119 RepID=A0A829BMZ1_STRMG|nr:hypothetical protein SMU3_09148 [Streptococcus mutans 11A1]EMB88453.1 hypothetical protein SMU56_01987 [Streptococcus mutans N29]EMB92476.1 hypothetical protein SMU58_00060 [Streptococcus mutans A19]EMB93694.1 hypothetical protein SMU62_09535 [Streptococcus mutans M21]EMB95419.1 hypothetical protein SMU60_01257 [Streptococcus mutans U138]EMB98851.1 hypothetical protein SMU63_07730 [Streptococcus mutans T4]EMC07032.1 hypothetical protein SMU72_09068 [Streptococcus mutans NLML9]EMC16158.1 h